MHREHYTWTQPHAVTVPELVGLEVGTPDEPGAIEDALVDSLPDGFHVQAVVAWVPHTCEHCAMRRELRGLTESGDQCQVAFDGRAMPLNTDSGVNAHVAQRWLLRRYDKGDAAVPCPLFRGPR